MIKYRCDICQGLDEKGDSYFGYNSTYGYCDNPECKEEATRRLGEDIGEQIDTGRADIALEIAGDEDPSLYL